MAAFFAATIALLFSISLIFKVFKSSISTEIKPLGVGKKLVPNGSMGYFPLLGETLSFLKPHKSNSQGTFLQQHCSKYGKVFKSHLFGSPTIVSCDHDLNAFVLQNEGTLFRSSYPKPVHDILGKLSMMLVSGDLHKKLRSVALKFVNASKSSPRFLDYVDKMCVSLIHSWKSKTQVVFTKEAKQLTFYLMLKHLVSVDLEDPIAANILGEFLTFMEGFVSLPLYIPGTAYSKAVNARRSISSTLKDIINKRRGENNAMRREDFLDEILENVSLNDEERVSVLLDLLLAGYETTSGLMALVVYFLAHAPPSTLETLEEEHMDVRRRKKDIGESLNWEDYKNMEFTSHVINESLRCGNLVKFVHRRALKDVIYKEYVIPKGWQVLPIILAAHLDPSLHPNPTEFDPWRWADMTTTKKVSPYGGGLRICPGAEIGKLETAFFIHHFVLNFRWKTSEEDCPISRPYLEFSKGLLLELQHINKYTQNQDRMKNNTNCMGKKKNRLMFHCNNFNNNNK